jgi:DNA-binding response OmpR family regulator
MVVEDDPMIVRLVTQMLEGEEGITVTSGGADVTKLMQASRWESIDIAVVDLGLPRVTGDELLRWLGENAPHVRRIAMSGWGPDRIGGEAPCEVRLLKPFLLDDLIAALRP